MEWIKCSDRLPKSNINYWSEEVIALSNLGDVFILSCMGEYWQRSSKFIDSGATKITHWMPLPAPPAE